MDPSVYYFDRPSGSELTDHGLPNCVAPDCTYYSDYTDFNALDYENDYTPGGLFYAYVEVTEWWEDATVASGGIDIEPVFYDSNSLVDYAASPPDASGWTIKAASLDVYLTSDGSAISSIYFDFWMEIPDDWSEEWFYRMMASTTDSTGNYETEYYPSSSLRYITIPVAAEFTGGGNSGQIDYVESEDAFFDQIGENCFEIVNTWLDVDFTVVTSPADSAQEGGVVYRKIDDYIAVQITMDPDETWSSGDMAGGTMLKDVGW
jgi:hypothetical protein